MPSSGIQVTDAIDLLRRWLKNANLRAGVRIPSERLLAAEIGVTHYAVNRAMTRLILEGVVEREGYKLRYTGGNGHPEITETFTCDLVVSSRSVFLGSFRRVAKELGIKLNVHRWESSEEAATIMNQLSHTRTEGILFDGPAVPVTDWEPITREMIQNGVPVVCVGQSVHGVTTVLSESSLAARKTVDYAASLGHHEFGLIVVHSQVKWLPSIRSNWERACLERGCLSSSDRIKVFDGNPKDLAEFCAREWGGVTCVVVQHEKFSVDQFVEELPHFGKRVPRDVSVISMGVTKSQQSGSIVTTVQADTTVIHELAYHWLQRIRRKREATGLMPPPTTIHVDPMLTVRSTVAPPAGMPRNVVPASAAELPPALPNPWTGNQVELMKTLQQAVQRPYPLALRAREAEFTKVDLMPFTNRPLNFRRGWLGDLPLKYLDAGRHIIHGVPFHVLGGPSRSDCGVVVFQSSVNYTGKAQKLPNRLRIPIESRVKSLYILHGCGFSRPLQTFASYAFYSKKKVLDRIALVTLGDVPPGTTAEELERLKDVANIQDWWPDYPQLDFKHGRMVPLLESEGHESLQRHSFLYTLEWVNPMPDQKVSFLEVTSEINQPTTLGLLAISLLA